MELMTKTLDPRVQGFEKKVKLAGVAVVAVLASVVVIVGGLTLITAGIVALGALAMVNFVPVAARWMALKKQAALTHLAEEFSEETIREDECQEEARVGEVEQNYQTTKAELEGGIEELSTSLVTANEAERPIIQSQIDQMNQVIVDMYADLELRQTDLKELKRVNGILIPLDRAARSMARAKQAERNPEERQRMITARNAIKTRMRSALAGQQVSALRRNVHGSATSAPARVVPQVGHSPAEVIELTTVNSKEKVNVPNRR